MERIQHNLSKKVLRRSAFTLVELLVVITIIGILTALISAAGAGALEQTAQAAGLRRKSIRSTLAVANV